MKIPLEETTSFFRVPDLEDLSGQVVQLAEQVEIKSAQIQINAWVKSLSDTVIKRLIYDEQKFINFIQFCQKQNWITQTEAQRCLDDLKKESPQEFLTLFSKTEAIAALGWMLPALYEFFITTDQSDPALKAALIYTIGSITRASGSYYLSEGVVENRKLLAAGEGIPHIGRVSLFIILAEEHPELARMLWAYRACRKFPQKAEKNNLQRQKAEKKFNRKHQSPVIEFIIAPKEFSQNTLLEWQVKSKTLQVAQSVGQTLGVL